MRRDLPFESDQQPSSPNFGGNKREWLNSPSLAKGILVFWIVVFGVAILWHRTSSHGPADQRNGAKPSDAFLSSVPAFGYPALQYFADLYKSAYNMYRRLLVPSAPNPISPPHRSLANSDAPNPEIPKPPAGVVAYPLPENHLSPPANEPEPPNEPVESADVPKVDLATPDAVPVTIPTKAAALPTFNRPHDVLPDKVQLGANSKKGLMVAPVGLPGYEPSAVIRKYEVKPAYPKVQLVTGPSVQQDQAQN